MDRTIARAPLEDWFRTRYFECSVDISSSGVADYTLGEVRTLLGVDHAELDGVSFRDSPTRGCDRLREAVAARYAPGCADSVMVTHGSSEAILLAMATVVERGDEIIVLAPVYHALSAVAQSLGATLKVWELSPEDGFRPDLEDLRRLLGARTKAVVVNFPHNPTGATLSANQYAEFVELINRRGVFLFWDGAFSDLHYETPGLLDPVASVQKCVSFGTLSKAYGLPGVRIGWCFAPESVLREMVKLRDYTTISCSPLLEHLAAAVVERADLLIAPRLAQAAANRAQLAEWAAANLDIVEYTPPLGGVTVFPRFASDGGTTEVCEDLAREDGVLVVPGSCFGLSNHIRIGFGGPSELLSTGLERLTARVRKAA